jgi:hypothetical protein
LLNTLKRAQKRARMRKLCKVCQQRPVAINYYKGSKLFYRSKCDHCARGYTSLRPLWAQHGYKQKNVCDKCGFSSKYKEQFNVFHLDGDLTNCRYNNLKTVCANCQRVLHTEGHKWKQGDLTPDF